MPGPRRSHVWHAFTTLIEGSRRLALLSLLLSVAQSLAFIPIALLVQRIFDDAIPGGERSELLLLTAGIAMLYLAGLGLGLAGRYAVLAVSKPAVARVRSELVKRVMSLPTAFHDESDRGRLHSLIVQDTERLDVMAKSLLSIVIPAAGTATLLLVSLVVIEPVLVLVFAVAAALVFAMNSLLRGPVRRRIEEWQRQSDSFSAAVLRDLGAVRLIKLRTAEERSMQEISARAAELGVAGQRMGWMQHAYGLSQVALGGLAGALVLLVGGTAVIDGSMSLGDLIAFMAILALARGQLNWVSAALPDIFTGLAAVERIEELRDTEMPEPYRGRGPARLDEGISLEDVSFGYVPSHPVLTGISLRVSPGEWLAVLGPSGAGKSTLMALMLGLYRPWEGRLLAGGIPYDELDIRALRRQAGVLLQSGGVLRGSIRENITLGRPDATPAEVEEAARIAAIDGLVAGAESGYETEVGDEGEHLSAGERQRLALARAVLGRPALLILDEPTSNLDSRTSQLVLDNLATLPSSPTTVLITHDPLVAERAHRVIEVRDGRLSEASALHG